CKKTNSEYKQETCNSIVKSQGTYPYYYFNDYNKLGIVYLTHKNNYIISIDTSKKVDTILFYDNIDKNYQCKDEANFRENTITSYDKNSIILPISANKELKLIPMDYENENDNHEIDVCSIFSETVSKAKPLQFPYSTFDEINAFEMKSPISLFLSHLYYKHNTTNEGSFKDIINECCNIIDDSFIPYCKNNSNIIISLDKCDSQNLKRKIIYLNCKMGNEIKFPNDINCNYIPFTNTK
ncbi:hypothetical protein PIROE2DRAFT_15870, partial [Piromyces sp. E2]